MSVHVIVVAAICGNWWVESNVNPGIWENLDPQKPPPAGYGLGQWTDWPAYGLYRRTNLFNWLSANGYAQDDGYGQLAYFEYENYWTSGTGQYSALFTDLQNFLSYIPTGSQLPELETLTYAFQQGWEGLTTPQSIRYQHAQNVLDYLIQHGTDPRQPWVKGNRYLSINEIYSNCLLVYDYLNGYVPPTPPTPEDPIEEWQMAVIRKIKLKRERSRKDDISKRKSTYIL